MSCVPFFPPLADRCQKSVFVQYKTSLAFHQLTGLPLRQRALGDEFRSQTFNGSGIRVGGAEWPRMLPLIDWQELICGCECENSY